MTSINAVNPAAASSQPAAAATGNANGLSSLADPNTFLKLLVAQLKYQNPLSPTSGTQFLAQTAQLTEVQTLTGMQASLKDQLTADQAAAAANLMGRTVTGTGPSGTPVTGTVTAASLGGTPTLDVAGTEVALSSITKIS